MDQAAAPLLPETPLPPSRPRAAGAEHPGAWEPEPEKRLPRLSPEAGKGLACPVVLASVGIRECEGPGVHAKYPSPARVAQWAPDNRSCSWDGWTLLQKTFIQTGGVGWGGCTKFSSAGVGVGVPERNRKQCLGESSAGRGGSPALKTRTGQGTQHRQPIRTQKPPHRKPASTGWQLLFPGPAPVPRPPWP